VERRGEPVRLGGRQQRAVLAFLLTRGGATAGVSVLADALWGERVPPGAAQTYVSHLRDALEPGRDKSAPSRYIRTERTGYRLVIDGDRVDAVEFEERVARGLAAVQRADFEAGKSALTAALGLWRGEVLADLADYGFVLPVAARYAELRAAATEALIDARLGLGEHRSLIPELDALIAADPQRERLHGLGPTIRSAAVPTAGSGQQVHRRVRRRVHRGRDRGDPDPATSTEGERYRRTLGRYSTPRVHRPHVDDR
jgi:DNA-binding SARP family transcriptional activator